MAHGPEEVRPPMTSDLAEQVADVPDDDAYSTSDQAGEYASDLPADFDPANDEHVRALSDEQINGVLDDLHQLHPLAVGSGSDISWAMLNPGEFATDVDPKQSATTYAVLREFVRRVVRIPGYNLTPDYLFGEGQEGEK